jgi:hypothetical protein
MQDDDPRAEAEDIITDIIGAYGILPYLRRIARAEFTEEIEWRFSQLCKEWINVLGGLPLEADSSLDVLRHNYLRDLQRKLGPDAEESQARLERKRAATRERVRRFRERQKNPAVKRGEGRDRIGREKRRCGGNMATRHPARQPRQFTTRANEQRESRGLRSRARLSRPAGS